MVITPDEATCRHRITRWLIRAGTFVATLPIVSTLAGLR